MQRRKFLVGAGSLFAGAAAATGTGAFSNGTVERGMQAHVANDSNAYVELEQGYGADHVTFENGRLKLDFTNSSGPSNNPNYQDGATGLNDNARSCFDSVLRAHIRDPDPQTVQSNPPYKDVGWVTTDASRVHFYWDSANAYSVTGSSNQRDFTPNDGNDDKPDDYVFPIGVCIDLRDSPNINPGDDIFGGKQFTFHVKKVSV